MLSVNTNISSLNAQRSLQSNSQGAAVAMERLASGKRINSAKDDAAGLAISNRLESQIKGVTQGIRNLSDATSALQVAEGGMASIENNLQRIRELAVQASNGTYSDADRSSLNSEATQLLAEVDRVASTTGFGGQSLLDGTFTNKNFNLGNAEEELTISIDGVGAATLGVSQAEEVSRSSNFGIEDYFSTSEGQESSTISDGLVAYSTNVLGKSNFAPPDDSSTNKMRGASFDFSDFFLEQVTAATLKLRAIPLDDNKGEGNDKIYISYFDASGNNLIPIYEIGLGVDEPPNNYFNFDWQIDNRPSHPAIGYDIEINLANFNSQQGSNLNLIDDLKQYGRLDVLVGDDTMVDFFDLQVTASIPTSISSQAFAVETIGFVDAALANLSASIAEVGAQMNRIESAISTLQITKENSAAAKSRIVDADYAAETAKLAKYQILQQASISVLAQANSRPEMVLALLRDL